MPLNADKLLHLVKQILQDVLRRWAMATGPLEVTRQTFFIEAIAILVRRVGKTVCVENNCIAGMELHLGFVELGVDI